MSGLLQVIKSLLPASRRAARELAEAQLAKSVADAYIAKVAVWGGALAAAGIAVSLGACYWQRAKSARRAVETAARESALLGEVVLANRNAGHARVQREVQRMLMYEEANT